MQLPEAPDGGIQIGISDLLGYRDCPARFAVGMERWSTRGEAPGQTNENNAYGSAIHDAVHLVETQGLANAQAIEAVWPTYCTWLDPADLALLGEDLDHYRGEAPVGYELVGSEMECRVPLFVYDGKKVYFRFRLDSLYRRINDPTAFLLRDLKSSRHRKTQAEVDADIQMWSYSFGIHELFVEARSLLISYEQLRHGTLKTSRSPQQRKQMRDWLIRTAATVIEDEKLEPRQNQWCAYCDMVVTCPVTRRATDFWRGRLGVLAPQTKEGRKTKMELLFEADDLEKIITLTLPRAIQTRKHLEAFEKKMKELIEEMPQEKRAELGWRLQERKSKSLPPGGLRAMHELLGDSFYDVVSMSRAALEALEGKPEKGQPLTPGLQLLREEELESVTASSLTPTVT